MNQTLLTMVNASCAARAPYMTDRTAELDIRDDAPPSSDGNPIYFRRNTDSRNEHQRAPSRKGACRRTPLLWGRKAPGIFPMTWSRITSTWTIKIGCVRTLSKQHKRDH